MPALSRQFNTGIPFNQPPPVNRAVLPMNINIPRLPNEDPSEEPTKNPNNSTTKQSQPSTKTNRNGNSFWNTVGRDIGIGAGALASAGAGLAKNPVGEAEDIIDAGKGIFTRAASAGESDLAPAISAGSKLINGADYNVLQPAEQAVKGIATRAAPRAISSWQNNLSSQFDDIMNNNGLNDLLNWGSDALNGVTSAAKSTNSFLESTSNGGGLVNAAKGTGRFSPAGSETAPESSGLKSPDSIENIGSDLGDILTGDFAF